MKIDFSGWATKNDLKCSDGRIIRQNAFKHNDGQTVPLVWNHQHNDPFNVLGKAMLENRSNGVYAHCEFNDTEQGQNARQLVKHGDVAALSIYANKLKQNGSDVLHGEIREVSLVLAGANPGAYIDNIIRHGENMEDEAVIFTGEPINYEKDEEQMTHSNDNTQSVLSHEQQAAFMAMFENMMDNKIEHVKKEETIQDIFDSLSEKQKTAVYAIIGALMDSGEIDEEDEDNEGDDEMKQSVFMSTNEEENTLTHDELTQVFADGKMMGSLKESVLQHGIEQIDTLFPDAKNIANTPSFITRDQTWVNKVMMAIRKTPFSRIKTIFGDLTEDDARAKGYIKGNMKKEQVFTLLKRTTSPTTVYKKQKLDRDDVIDITDFDVVAWIKSDMRLMLDEELARAVLIGDGRISSSDDKINEGNIRPIWTDDAVYTIKTEIDTSNASQTVDQRCKLIIRQAVKARKDYKGSGNPTFYTTEDILTDLLLMEDTQGRVIYDTQEKLANALRVKEIITVPVMENATRVVDTKTHTLFGIIVNLMDYNMGADKGGAVNLFDDFDIDYNAQKYLIETRASGALIKPYSAIVIEGVEPTDSGAQG